MYIPTYTTTSYITTITNTNTIHIQLLPPPLTLPLSHYYRLPVAWSWTLPCVNVWAKLPESFPGSSSATSFCSRWLRTTR